MIRQVSLVLLLFAGIFASQDTAQAQTIKPEPIALPRSVFPADSHSLDALIASQDTAALRRHAWTLWSGITANSHQSVQGQVLPIFETWLSEQNAFSAAARRLVQGLGRRILLPLSHPSQFRHRPQTPVLRDLARGRASPILESLLASVKLSPDSADFLQASHETPAGGGHSYSYKSAHDLTNLNGYFDQNATPVAGRKIIDFPAPATDLKLVFLPVKAKDLSPIPIWQGQADSTNPDQPTPDTWKSCVAVDPTDRRSGTASIDCNGQTVTAEIVPLNRFFSVRLDAARARAINALTGLHGAGALAAGDYHVLVAIHVTTKEIANWTWATFWWQNGSNPPDKFPGSVDDLPDADQVKGVWRNYAMCIADAIVTPFNDPHGTPVVCFNPYLETSQPDGVHSNCMSCHARATFPGVDYPSSYVPNGWVDLADPNVFARQSKTDFVWSIQNSAH
jgi:hypothetical protein